MGFKHSPAPWHLRDGINEGFILLDDNYHIIALLDSTKIKREDKNLIVTAPELLEQLIRLRNKIASYKPNDGDDLDIVDAVIAKALGEKK